MDIQLSPKQALSIATKKKRLNIWEGAVRSGKSYACLWSLIQMCHEAPEGSLMIVGRTNASIKRNVIDELVSFPGISCTYYPGKCELFLEGRKIYCVGFHDERSEMKIRGWTGSGALVEEMSLIPQNGFLMLLSRLSRPGAYLIGNTNPDSPFHWLKKDFIDRKNELDMNVWSFRMEDNPSLSQEYIKQLNLEYRGLFKKRFIDGEWCIASGAIYSFFNEKEHVISEAPCKAKFYIVGIDYGNFNPCAFVLIGFNEESMCKMWVEKEYFFSGRDSDRQKGDVEYAEDFFRFIQGYLIQMIYIDPSALSFILELRRVLPSAPIKDCKNDVLNGIQCVSTHLTVGNLKILSSCKELIKEFFTYSWDEKASNRGVDQPLKANDHLLDALRYAIFTCFGNQSDIVERKKNLNFDPFKNQNKWTLPPFGL